MSRFVRPAPAIALAAVICALVCVLVPGLTWIRLPFALALLFVLPGFSLWSALFPNNFQDRLRTGVFSVGLSVVVGVFAGIEAGAYGRLSDVTWAGTAAGITVVAAIVAERRGGFRRLPADVSPPTRRRVRVGAVAATGAAVLVIGAAVGLARTPLPVPDDRGYTVLSVDPSASDRRSVAVDIASSEATTRAFTLEIRVPGAAPESRPIVVEPGQTLEERIEVPDVALGTVRILLLDRSSGTLEVYRRVRINLPVQAPAPPIPRRSPG